MSLRGKATQIKVVGGLAAAVLLLTVVLLFSAVSHTKAYVNATTHQPERFTELYFTSPLDLPTSARSSLSLPIQFTVHNREASNVAYTYQVAFTTASGQTTVIDERHVSIANNAVENVTDNPILPAFTGRAEVSVLLPPQHEAIHFWLESANVTDNPILPPFTGRAGISVLLPPQHEAIHIHFWLESAS